MLTTRRVVWCFLVWLTFNFVESNSVGQCVEFDEVDCDELVSEAVSCESMECVWWQPGEFIFGRWLCPDLIGKELVEDAIKVTIPIDGDGTQYFIYGETKNCSVIFDCNCRHINPVQGGGNCQNYGESEEDDLFTDQEPGSSGEYDFFIVCVSYSELP